MRRVRAEWDRERTSVRNKPFPLVLGLWLGWDHSLALHPPLGHPHLPTSPLYPLPSCCLEWEVSSMAQRGAERL